MQTGRATGRWWSRQEPGIRIMSNIKFIDSDELIFLLILNETKIMIFCPEVQLGYI